MKQQIEESNGTSRWHFIPNGIYGGDPPVEPVGRYYPAVEKRRPVIVGILKFYGLGRHYWVKVQEEYNFFFDNKEKRWREPWMHTSHVWHLGALSGCYEKAAEKDIGVGKLFEDKFTKEVEVRDFVERIVAEHFPEETHIVIWECTDAKRKWFYREGD